jgi:hypothetical protein
LNQVYFNNINFEREVNFEGATFNGAFSISESELKKTLLQREFQSGKV